MNKTKSMNGDPLSPLACEAELINEDVVSIFDVSCDSGRNLWQQGTLHFTLCKDRRVSSVFPLSLTPNFSIQRIMMLPEVLPKSIWNLQWVDHSEVHRICACRLS